MHGRLEKRERYGYNDIGWLNNREKWIDLYGIGMIVSTVEEKGHKSEQRHYFIYNCSNLTADELMKAKRAHWGIENSLHWVLDMSFREDESRARKDYSAENFNALRQFAYTILKAVFLINNSSVCLSRILLLPFCQTHFIHNLFTR